MGHRDSVWAGCKSVNLADRVFGTSVIIHFALIWRNTDIVAAYRECCYISRANKGWVIVDMNESETTESLASCLELDSRNGRDGAAP